jgi:malate synthase
MTKQRNKNSARNQRKKLRKKQLLEDRDNLSMDNLYNDAKIDPDTYVGQVRVDIPQMKKALEDSKSLNKMNEHIGWKSWIKSWIW